MKDKLYYELDHEGHPILAKMAYGFLHYIQLEEIF